MNRALLTVIGVMLVGYGIFEARRLIEGPVIVVTSPKQGSATSTTALHITGTARNISFLTINDKPAYTDVAGNFTYVMSPPPGYTVVKVAGKDRFGRHASRLVFITVTNFCPASLGSAV